MRWSLFCRVVDNFGDAGFCLRLARELRARGEQVDLFIDDPAPLVWMQAGEPDPLIALPWPEQQSPPLGDVVIEAFGCELPTSVQLAIAALPRPPLWVNLEYLSAESYVERSHGLPSPVMSGPARGLVKRFCYPGFSGATGGLLIERDLARQQAEHRAERWLAEQGLPVDGRRRVSLFCYPGAPLPALFEALADRPTRLFVCGRPELPAPPPGLAIHALPLLNQADYDRLLWSCELNLVRGEDSFVRAQLAGRPMLWQLYPQQDGAHRIKLDAFLSRYRAPGNAELAWCAWNGFAPASALADGLGDVLAGTARAADWRAERFAGVELVTTLQSWAAQNH
jgi:uncharacterized repeat protein (TIGR03837 family)